MIRPFLLHSVFFLNEISLGFTETKSFIFFSENTVTAASPFAVSVLVTKNQTIEKGGNCFCVCGVLLFENLGIVTANLSK